MQNYRSEFDTPKKAQRYEYAEYSADAYSSILWRIEQLILVAELSKLRAVKSQIDYLDFACGTGRIISYLEGHVDRATGIDVSENMLAIASQKIERAKILCMDITRTTEIESKYDFITGMRFLLNAEPPLRAAALNALRDRLRDKESRLVINNHGNLFSHKILMWPYHRIREWLHNESPRHYLTHQAIVDLADRAGLEIESVHGYGLMGAKSLNVLPRKLIEHVEYRFSKLPILREIGVNQIYVMRRPR